MTGQPMKEVRIEHLMKALENIGDWIKLVQEALNRIDDKDRIVIKNPPDSIVATVRVTSHECQAPMPSDWGNIVGDDSESAS